MKPIHYLIAACMMHVEGYYSTKSLAFRNKNPGNIEVIGKPGVFRVYPDALAGYLALVQDIAANAGKPLSAFLSKYAPPNENNTAGLYIPEVCTLAGITPDFVL